MNTSGTDPDLASRQQARELVRAARKAFEVYRRFSQEEVDRICYAACEAGFRASRQLAELAVEETGFGRAVSKQAKNEFSTRGLWAYIRDLKTCGLVRSDEAHRVYEYADPFGVVAAIIPTTNPTSTALFKALICLKSRNAMVASPHPRATRCIRESVRVVADAAEAAGAPRGLLSCLDQVTLEGTEELMRDRGVDLILATGGAGLVRAAYSSGKPAFGVGPGNSPAWIDRSADLDHAARCIVDSQTFDNGTICASEQSLVIDRPIHGAFLAAMRKLDAHVCTPDEAAALARIVRKGRGMNPDIVGRYPWQLAEMAGFRVPREATVLLADCAGVGDDYPLSIEKLSPILSVFVEDGWEAGCKRCLEVLAFGGMGHTLAIHCRDEAIVREFAEKKPVNRLVVNSPASQGAVGFTTNLVPSMTLGCGSFGGNITSDNISPLHLVNIKRLAWVKPEYGTAKWTGSFPDIGPAANASPDPAARASTWESREIRSAPAPGPEPKSVIAPSDAPKPLWRPQSSSGTDERQSCAQSGLSPSDLYAPEDIQQIIQEALSRTRDDGCPLGRCADCPQDQDGPPDPADCHHQNPGKGPAKAY